MLLLGLAAWLVIAGFYAAWTVCACVACVVSAFRNGVDTRTRALLALWMALLLSPAGCFALFLPSGTEDGGTNPRILDSFTLSYALPFAAVFAAVWALSSRARRVISRA